MKIRFLSPFTMIFCLSAAASTCRADDITIAAFEGETYGAWQVEGAAFGAGPAAGTLPGQMAVGGFDGKRLVNSFHGDDDATGKLTSPLFKIERPFLNFLIGGGKNPHDLVMNLWIDGKIVRTATGPNDRPGGTENLRAASWNVAEFSGQSARIEIVDNAKGGWGHINVDNIMQSETDRGEKPDVKRTRDIVITTPLLHLPVKNGAPKRDVGVLLNGKIERHFSIELAADAANADWWAPLDVADWHGKTLSMETHLPENSIALDAISQDAKLRDGANLYREALRPQLHFSAQRGWLNDPNGMVYADGEYHLYFQHNPYGTEWGNMHWGHAVSRDLAHWRELPIALYPFAPNDAVFSGSAVVDKDNSSGWKQDANELIVAAYTSTARGEAIVYSNDRGRTFTEYANNPVVKHNGRDPRLLWHAPTQRWVMAVYSEDGSQSDETQKHRIDFYSSPDLKAWTFESRINNFYECPDIFELPLDGDAKNTRWILTAANSEYRIGSFDGKTFTPESGKLIGSRGRGFYAAQTFSHDPKGRTVQIGWMQAPSPAMSFNQAMSLPLQLSLRSTPAGPRLAWSPVEELKLLHTKTHDLGAPNLRPGAPNPAAQVSGELLELRATFTPPATGEVRFNLRGVPIIYNADKQQLSVQDLRVPLQSREGKIELKIFTDRTVYEIFANDGLVYVPLPIIPDAKNRAVDISASGETKFDALEIYQLKPIWTQ